MIELFPIRTANPFNVANIKTIKVGDVIWDVYGSYYQVEKVGRYYITLKGARFRIDLRTALTEKSEWFRNSMKPVFKSKEDLEIWNANSKYRYAAIKSVVERISNPSVNLTLKQAMAIELAVSAILGERL